MLLHTAILTDWYLSQAHSVLDKGNFITAKSMAEAALRLDPSFEAYNTLGLCFSSVDDFKRAIACFDKSIEIKPDQTDAQFYRTAALTMQGMMVRIDELEGGQALGIDEVITDVIYNLLKEDSNNV